MKTVYEIKSEYNHEIEFPYFLDKLAGEFDHEGYFEHLATLDLVEGDNRVRMYAYFKSTFVTNDEAFIVFPTLKRAIHTDNFDNFAIRLMDLGFKIFFAETDFDYSDTLLNAEERSLHCLHWLTIEE